MQNSHRKAGRGLSQSAGIYLTRLCAGIDPKLSKAEYEKAIIQRCIRKPVLVKGGQRANSISSFTWRCPCCNCALLGRAVCQVPAFPNPPTPLQLQHMPSCLVQQISNGERRVPPLRAPHPTTPSSRVTTLTGPQISHL